MEYAKRIYGFAYDRTGNSRDAEDLSQEILMELLRSDRTVARNEEAWVTGVCRHVWARYLHRNKRHWEAVGAAPALDFLAAEDEGLADAERQAEYAALRREIAFLSRTRREALVMYYFEGCSIDEIALKLNLAPATVRWHMSRARTELKGRLNMENRDGMRPIARLNVGHSGWTKDWKMHGLNDDLLTQNIAWVCYGKKCSVEEISRTLSVPAVYLEGRLEDLASVDYMRESGGRYTTNFFIADAAYQTAALHYARDHAPALADMMYEAAARLLPEIRAIGFVGSDLPEAELMWHVIPELSMNAYQRAFARVHEKHGLRHDCPVRPDGSRHWVAASVQMDGFGDAQLDALARGSICYGIKSRIAGPVESMQYDFALLGPWREFNDRELEQISEIVRSGGAVEEEMKESVAALAADGYVVVEDDRARVLIPYMRRAEHEAFVKLLDGAFNAAQQAAIYENLEGNMLYMRRFMPDFVDPNEQAHWLTSYNHYFGAIMYYLTESGRLTVPDDAARRLSTVLYETE